MVLFQPTFFAMHVWNNLQAPALTRSSSKLHSLSLIHIHITLGGSYFAMFYKEWVVARRGGGGFAQDQRVGKLRLRTSQDLAQCSGSQGHRPLNTTSDVPKLFAAEYIRT